MLGACTHNPGLGGAESRRQGTSRSNRWHRSGGNVSIFFLFLAIFIDAAVGAHRCEGMVALVARVMAPPSQLRGGGGVRLAPLPLLHRIDHPNPWIVVVWLRHRIPPTMAVLPPQWEEGGEASKGEQVVDPA